jgi:U3 small nucleolar RNA-associated protein 10
VIDVSALSGDVNAECAITGLATETATFILECSDDDNDDVVRECKRLKDAVERETGKIEGI